MNEGDKRKLAAYYCQVTGGGLSRAALWKKPRRRLGEHKWLLVSRRKLSRWLGAHYNDGMSIYVRIDGVRGWKVEIFGWLFGCAAQP